jgi:hypothetical protein
MELMMDLATKSAIYSGLVFPGTGYFFSQNKTKAWISILLSLTCLIIFMSEAVFKAQIIADKIIAGQLPFDILVIREQIKLVEGNYSDMFLGSITFLFVTTWLVSILDSYRESKNFQPH